MAWHRAGDKPLSEPMMVSLLTNICVTRPQLTEAISYQLYPVFGGISDMLYVSYELYDIEDIDVCNICGLRYGKLYLADKNYYKNQLVI